MKKGIIISSIVILSSILIWTYVGCLQRTIDFTSSGSLHLGINEKDRSIISDSCLNILTDVVGYKRHKEDYEFASYPLEDGSYISVWRILKENHSDLSKSFIPKKTTKAEFKKSITYVKLPLKYCNSYINLYNSKTKDFKVINVGGDFEVYTSVKDTLHFEGTFDFLNLSNSENETKIKHQGVLFGSIPKKFTQEVIVFNDEYGLVICTYIGKESESIKNILK